MNEFKDFWQAELGCVVRELDAELSSGYPDWIRVLLKADDLTALALSALKNVRAKRVERCKTPLKRR